MSLRAVRGAILLRDALDCALDWASTDTCRRLLSPEETTRAQEQDIRSEQEELRSGTGCALPRFSDCPPYPEQDGFGRGPLGSALATFSVSLIHMRSRHRETKCRPLWRKSIPVKGISQMTERCKYVGPLLSDAG